MIKDEGYKELVQSVEKRTARLEDYVSKLEVTYKQMAAEINRGEQNAFTEEEIRVQLSNLPIMIADVELFLAKIIRAYDYAKTDTKMIYADLWKDANERRDELNLTNAKDRESYVITQDAYKRAVQMEYEWKYNMNRCQAIYTRYDNQFTSVRKLANLLEKDQQNVYRREKYSNE